MISRILVQESINNLTSSITGRLRSPVFAFTLANLSAQLIAFVSSPFLTRIYSPAEYGRASIWINIILVVSSISTFSSHIAISKSKKSQGRRLSLISITTSLLFSILFLVLLTAFWIFGGSVSVVDGPSEIVLTSCAVVVNAVYFTMYAYYCRVAQWSVLAKKLISSLLVSLAVRFVIGLFYPRAEILVISYVLSNIIFCIFFTSSAFRSSKITFQAVGGAISNIIRNPKYSVLVTIQNSMSIFNQGAVIYVFGRFFSLRESGVLALSQSLVLLPTAAIGSIVVSYLTPRYSGLILRDIVIACDLIRATRFLVVAAGLFCSVIYLFLSQFFLLFFSDAWKDVPQFCLPLLLLGFSQLVSRPAVSAIYILKLEWEVFFYELTSGVCKLAIALYFAMRFEDEPILTLVGFCATGAVFYLLLTYYVIKISEMRIR